MIVSRYRQNHGLRNVVRVSTSTDAESLMINLSPATSEHLRREFALTNSLGRLDLEGALQLDAPLLGLLALGRLDQTRLARRSSRQPTMT